MRNHSSDITENQSLHSLSILRKVTTGATLIYTTTKIISNQFYALQIVFKKVKYKAAEFSPHQR